MSRSASTLFLLFFCLATLLGEREAFAQSASDLQNQINAHTTQIGALQAEIAQYEKQLTELGKQKDTLQGAISTLTVSQKQLTAELTLTQNKISSANLELKKLGSAITDKETAIVANQDAIAKALRSIAENEQQSIVEQTFGALSLADAWQQAEEAIQFNRALVEDTDSLRLAREQLHDDQEAVSLKKKELVTLQEDLTLQKKSVDLNKSAQQKLLTDTKNQESIYQKLIAEKQAEEAKFEVALFDLASRLEFLLDPSKIPSTGKGVLRYPLDDVFVTQEFGKSSSAKRLYASGTHPGVDFRATIGTPLRAARSGVVYGVNYGAAPNCQYGKWVMVKHDNGLATLYAHLSEISVKNGDPIVTGQLLGFSGNTGYATGPHLHFGLYLADAVSLKNYTCKNGQQVLIPVAPVQAYLNPLAYL